MVILRLRLRLGFSLRLRLRLRFGRGRTSTRRDAENRRIARQRRDTNESSDILNIASVFIDRSKGGILVVKVLNKVAENIGAIARRDETMDEKDGELIDSPGFESEGHERRDFSLGQTIGGDFVNGADNGKNGFLKSEQSLNGFGTLFGRELERGFLESSD